MHWGGAVPLRHHLDAMADGPATVTVAVRTRPMSEKEKALNKPPCVHIDKQNQIVSLTPPDQTDQSQRKFQFDFAYGMDETQTTLYNDIGKPMLDKAVDGWNGTIFAYGQTGAGKSFSMTGTPDKPGIVPQMNKDMFERIARLKEEQPGKKFLVTCAFLEIYNEVLFDLLDPSGKAGASKTRRDAGNIEIKENPKLGVYVAGLNEIPADSGEKILSLLDQGNAMRAIAATNMNATSSRSHSIFIVKMTSAEIVEGQKREMRSTINLVDLAGSERVSKTGATGAKLKEGANINKSLSALGAVINALAEQSKQGKKVFIPYRNSKLTRVLQESLGGNSVTVMLAAISPAGFNFEESLNTLQYADRAKAIQLKAKRNEELTEVGKLRREIDQLKAALAAAAATGPDNGLGSGENAKKVP